MFLFERRERLSWEEAFTFWRAAMTKRVPRSERIEQLLDPWRDWSLANLRLADFIAIGDALRTGTDGKSLQTTLVMVRKFFVFAFDQRWLARSLSDEGIRSALHGPSLATRDQHTRPDRKTWEAWRKQLLQAADAIRYGRDQGSLVLWLLLWRGVRAGEIGQIRARDVKQLKNGQWVIVVRGAWARHIELQEWLLSYLHRLQPDDPNEVLFIDRLSNPMNLRSVNVLLKTCCRYANIPVFNARTARSLYAHFARQEL